ncbi:hypothetical protein ACFY1J_26875 [Streptomyces sp. NPDC001406]|uniref:hypothetical protein n=1 Tax=Streptomyces sp. NPDC001406 TaxID=3364572 RepID=UPI003685537C
MSTPVTDPITTNAPHARPEEEDLALQRAAIAALGHELRALVDLTARTAAPAQTLYRVADEVRRLKGQLTGDRRTRAEIPAVDEFPGGVRMYSPVTGARQPACPAHAGDTGRRRHAVCVSCCSTN